MDKLSFYLYRIWQKFETRSLNQKGFNAVVK